MALRVFKPYAGLVLLFGYHSLLWGAWTGLWQICVGFSQLNLAPRHWEGGSLGCQGLDALLCTECHLPGRATEAVNSSRAPGQGQGPPGEQPLALTFAQLGVSEGEDAWGCSHPTRAVGAVRVGGVKPCLGPAGEHRLGLGQLQEKGGKPGGGGAGLPAAGGARPQ